MIPAPGGTETASGSGRHERGTGLLTPSGHDGDGRLQRGVRTRRAIAEAMIALIEAGNPQPSARRVAERAGVSLRLVYHHFDDIEAVFEVAAQIQSERHWANFQPVPPSGPLALRIDAVVRQRRRLYEAIFPVRAAATVRAQTSPDIAKVLAQGRTYLRHELSATFGPELDHGRAGGEVLLDALEVAAGWEAWDALRRWRGRSPVAAERAMRLALTGLLHATIPG